MMKTCKNDNEEGFSFIEVLVVSIMLVFVLASLSIIFDSGFSNILYFKKINKKLDTEKYLSLQLKKDFLSLYLEPSYKFIRIATEQERQRAQAGITPRPPTSPEEEQRNPFDLGIFGLTADDIRAGESVIMRIDNERQIFSFCSTKKENGIYIIKRVTYKKTNQGLIRTERPLNTNITGNKFNFGKKINFKINFKKRSGRIIRIDNRFLKNYTYRPDFVNITLLRKEKNKLKKLSFAIPFHAYPTMIIKYKADGSIDSESTSGGSSSTDSSPNQQGGMSTDDAELESEDI